MAVKAGVNMNLSEVLRGLKKGIEERKLFLEHHKIVDIHARALQVVRALFWCPSSNSNFKNKSNLQYFLFLQILLIL